MRTLVSASMFIVLFIFIMNVAEFRQVIPATCRRHIYKYNGHSPVIHFQQAARVLQHASPSSLVGNLFTGLGHVCPASTTIAQKAEILIQEEFNELTFRSPCDPPRLDVFTKSQRHRLQLIQFVSLSWVLAPDVATFKSNVTIWKIATSAAVLSSVCEIHFKQYHRKYLRCFLRAFPPEIQQCFLFSRYRNSD